MGSRTTKRRRVMASTSIGWVWRRFAGRHRMGNATKARRKGRKRSRPCTGRTHDHPPDDPRREQLDQGSNDNGYCHRRKAAGPCRSQGRSLKASMKWCAISHQWIWTSGSLAREKLSCFFRQRRHPRQGRSPKCDNLTMVERRPDRRTDQQTQAGETLGVWSRKPRSP